MIEAKTGASLNRYRSKQEVGTPWELIHAIEIRFGENFTWDLAAGPENAKAPKWISKETDSFGVNWSSLGGMLWLNPEFQKIGPWAKKCVDESALGAKIMMLTPASVGSNWYQEYIHGQAYVMALNPRVTFIGETSPYPKDLILSWFYAGVQGFEVWNWK